MRDILEEKVKRLRRAPRAHARDAARGEARLAGDLVEAGCLRLQASQPLNEALKTLCGHHLPELPVVDEDGCLVGTFAVEDAMKMCVPEHLLWAEDLTHFGPVGELSAALGPQLGRPLSDVMLVGGRLLTVSASAPLAEVARLLVRHSASQVIVVEGRELLGVITAQGLVARMLGH
jgi:CBS domain-containing protein